MKRRVFILILLLSISLSGYSIIRDSVLVLVSRNGYQVDVVNPGRYIVVRNYGGRKVDGKFRILNHRMILVGHTVVPIRNISKLTIKSEMYPISRSIAKTGNFFISLLPKQMLSSLSFDTQGPAAVLFFLIFVLVALVSIVLGSLIMLVALPGLIVGRTYDMGQWKIYIRPKRA